MPTPIRTCIGCLVKKPKDELVRLVVGEDGEAVIDPSGEVPGRGAYLCFGKGGQGVSTECFEKAAEKKAFGRAFRKKVEVRSLEKLT